MLLALISPDSLTLSPQEFAFCTYYSMETAPVQLINDYLFFFFFGQTQQLRFGAHQKPMICSKKYLCSLNYQSWALSYGNRQTDFHNFLW